MKIADYKDDAALDLVADLIEPIGRICANPKFSMDMGKGLLLLAVKDALKSNKKDVVEVLARVEGVEPEEYHCTVVSLFTGLLSLLSNPELLGFFGLQVQSKDAPGSGLATESTEAGEP